ncbi:MAG TPA: phosphatidylglycerophosphatase A [Nitratifractor salsuginis]|uniref:Phosphatidylglycerophosphatase A n=1 Tax=Nitratifractor salsuginis TaxID=269261 RepID=A0A7V2SIN1_9BACT|nr:phosphatidylglycerophosphatase A [Nitratifractor salsuginis]
MKLSELFLTFFGAGRLPAPRISTTVIAWALGLGWIYLLGAESLFTLAFALFIIGIFEVTKAENRGMEHNAPSIVIDEAVGVWVALCVGTTALAWLPDSPMNFWLLSGGTLGAYLLFILWSPSTIGWICRNLRGGLGVMLDDILAGFAAGLLVLLAAKGYMLL